ncbi:hypothetical protein GCM10020366_20390 [Saccharopolyspora gregorii]|uniref:Uncharacterized protein n=1 Tax=Saccharopolyspora gregorii TaxID=33914 RepID=A0ABP6RMB7_9PSEU
MGILAPPRSAAATERTHRIPRTGRTRIPPDLGHGTAGERRKSFQDGIPRGTRRHSELLRRDSRNRTRRAGGEFGRFPIRRKSRMPGTETWQQ